MNGRRLGISLLVIGLLWTGSALAEPPEGPGGGGKDEAKAGRRARGRRGGERQRKGLMAQLAEDSDLSEEQRGQVAEILRTHRQAMKNWHDEHAAQLIELRKQFAEARKAGDKDKIKQLAARRKELMAGRKALTDQLFERLGGILSKEQLAKVRRMLSRRQGQGHPLRGVPRALKAAGASDEQVAQAKVILAEAVAKAKELSEPGEKARVFRGAIRKISQTVLTTDEQRERFMQALRRMRRAQRGRDAMRGLDLSPEQVEKIRQIRQEYRGLLAKAETPEAKRNLGREMREKIAAELTEEQRKKWRRSRRGRGRDRAARRGERRGGRRRRNDDAPKED